MEIGNKYKKLLLFLTALVLLGSCMKEYPESGIPDENLQTRLVRLQASPSGETRAGFDSDGKFFWSSGDRIGITTTASPDSFSGLTLIEGAGTSLAVFEGEIKGELSGTAVYPGHVSHRIDGNTLTYFLPELYRYEKIDRDFFSGEQGKGVSFNPPMWGKVESGRTMMKHLGGVFCIKAEALPVGEQLVLTLSSDQKMNGNFTADLSAETPVLQTSDSGEEAGNQVTILFSNTEQNTSGVFYIPAPTGTYSDLSLTIYRNGQTLLRKDFGSRTLRRGSLKKLIVGKETEDQWKNKTFWVDGIRNPSLDRWGYAFTVPYKIPGLEWKREYGWYDCNKTFVIHPASGDDNLCWAATASNLIYWWLDRNRENLERYGKYTGPKIYNSSRDCEVFQFFKDHYINEGNWVNSGIDWFFYGKNPGTGLKADSDHKGFLSDVLQGQLMRIGSGYTLTEDLKTAFRNGEAIGLVIDVKAGRARHAITVWGADFDAAGEVCALYVTENNDLEMELDQNVPSPMQPGKLCRIGLYRKRVRKDGNGYFWMESSVQDRFTIGIYEVDYLGTHQKEWEEYFSRTSTPRPLR